MPEKELSKVKDDPSSVEEGEVEEENEEMEEGEASDSDVEVNIVIGVEDEHPKDSLSRTSNTTTSVKQIRRPSPPYVSLRRN